MKNLSIVIEQLRALGFSLIPGRRECCFTGNLIVGNESVSIELEVSDWDFIELPIIRLDPSFVDHRELRGHMTEGAALCYTDCNILILDRYQPVGSIRAALKLAKDTLTKLLHENTDADIRAEITAYWKGDTYYLLSDPRILTNTVMGQIVRPDKTIIEVIASSAEQISDWASKTNSEARIGGGVEIVQLAGDIPAPPLLNNLEAASQWVDEISEKSSTDALSLINEEDDAPSILIVGDNGVIGFTAIRNIVMKRARKGQGFRKSSLPSLWKGQSSQIEVKRFHCQLASHSEIVSRNHDAQAPLTDLKICLIGCGTIGGHLARMLVQCGAGTNRVLRLVDNDVFLPENVGRHSLGATSINKPKATALAEALGRDFPEVFVEASNSSAQEIWGQFKNFDLIVDATGNEAFSVSLNHHAKFKRQSEIYPPVIYSMIFGNGVAVQSFLETGEESDACYKCLKPVFSDDWRFNPVKNKVGKTITSVRPCSIGSFVPYGVEASISAATLTLRQVIDFSQGNLQSTLRTVVLDRESGIDITDKTISKAAKCPVCAGQAHIE